MIDPEKRTTEVQKERIFFEQKIISRLKYEKPVSNDSPSLYA